VLFDEEPTEVVAAGNPGKTTWQKISHTISFSLFRWYV